MIRVRFPDGQAVTYNDGFNLTYNAGHLAWEIADRTGVWLAAVQTSAGAIIERVNPCSVTNPIEGVSISSAIKRLLTEARSVSGYADLDNLAKLKAMLRDFNSTTRKWR